VCVCVYVCVCACAQNQMDCTDTTALVANANLITSTMNGVECNRLRMELELGGGMSNDHRLFPFHIPGQAPVP
jgi:hypothetical protein